MKSGTLTKNWVAENNGISLVVNHKADEIRMKPELFGIRWYFFVLPLAMTCGLLLPQVREFFLSSGLRWVHVMMLSFGLSFSLTPLFSWIAYNLNILDRPDQRKLHQKATPLLGGASVFAGFLAALLT